MTSVACASQQRPPKRVAVLAALMLSACAETVRPPSLPTPTGSPGAVDPAPPPATLTPAPAGKRVVVRGKPAGSLGMTQAMAERGLRAFRISCPRLVARKDSSSLTRAGDWQGPCDAARTTADRDALGFFLAQFDTVRVGDGAAFATGYYEPEIAAARTRDAAHAVPVYRRPDDLVEVDLSPFSPAYAGKTIRGRVVERKLVPYHDRAAIEDGALAGQGLELGWAADPVELFFLQVQGSGRLRLPDGTVMRIGYDGQNGREYVGIGALMRERGLLGPGERSMQGIMRWLRANPAEGRALMRENKSWVFFRELTGSGPIGAMGVPVSERASVAADPAFVPLGAPVWLALDRSEASGLWVAQDTGGAIKGANRFDTFWGAGNEARTIAGGLSARGTALVLLPKPAVARLLASDAPPAAP